MLCNSCGGNSINTVICDYCGKPLPNVDSSIEIQKKDTVERSGVRYKKNSRIPVEGIVVEYNSSGQLRSSVPYKAGVEHGLAEAFDDLGSGLQRQTQNYKNGKLERAELFYPNSHQTQWISVFTGGRRTIEQYYENGKLKEKYQRNEKLQKNGPYEAYYEDGRLRKMCTYKNGDIVRVDESYEDKNKSETLMTNELKKKSLFGKWFRRGIKK
jgi:Uncharacterized protein conserved in bacteria